MKAKFLILATALLATATVVTLPTVVKADWSPTSSSGCVREPQNYIAPVTLGQLAYQGLFSAQGIPSAGGLESAYSTGKVTPQLIVQAAIKGCILTNKYKLDQNEGYINDLDQELKALLVAR